MDNASNMNELLHAVESGSVASVYFLCGEHYPVEQVTLALRRVVLGAQEAGGLNYDNLQAKEAGIDEVLATARTVPMFGGRRVVQVRDAHLFGADDLSRLLPYVRDPSPFTCLVLIGEKADLRLKFFAELKKRGVVQRFEPLKDRQVAAWLTAEAKRRNVQLAPGSAERIAEAVGADMGALVSALEQLALYAGIGQIVTPEQVEELLAQTREHSIFELTNAVGRGQRRDALHVLHRMLQDRESGVRIVAMLARHVRQLWSAKELAARGLGQQAVATQLGIHPFFVGDLIHQAGRISEDTMMRMHQALFEADRSLKSSRLSDELILEQLVLTLCPATAAERSPRG